MASRVATWPKVQQYLRSTAAGAGQLDAELERIPAEDGKELLRRDLAYVAACRAVYITLVSKGYCEKLVKLRQREKQQLRLNATAGPACYTLRLAEVSRSPVACECYL